MAPVANLIRTSSGTSQSRTLVCAIIPVIHAASTEFEIGAVLNYWLLFNSTPHNHLLFHQPLNLRHHRHLFQMKWWSRGLPDIIAGNWWMQVSRWKDVPNRFPMAPFNWMGFISSHTVLQLLPNSGKLQVFGCNIIDLSSSCATHTQFLPSHPIIACLSFR